MWFDDSIPAWARRYERWRPIGLLARGGEHDPLERARCMLERAGCQLVLGLRVPFGDHLPGDAVERHVAEGLVEPSQRDFVASVGPAG